MQTTWNSGATWHVTRPWKATFWSSPQRQCHRERIRTLANGCGRLRTRKQRPANTALPSDSQVKREPFATFRYAFGKTKQKQELSTCDHMAAAAVKSSPERRSWRETSLEDKAAAKSSPEWRSWRETSLGDKAEAAAKSSPERRSWRETNAGRQGGSGSGSQEQPRIRQQRRPRAAQNGDHEGRQAWETRRQRQPRAAQKGNYEGRQMQGDKAAAAAAAKSNPEWRSWRETNEGRQGSSGGQERPRMEFIKGDKFGRQGGSQKQPRPEIMKGDKWRETRRQRQPRAAQNGDHEASSPEWRSWRETNEGRQGSSGIATIWRLWGSATQSLRSMNPYSFQLSGEKSGEGQENIKSVTISCFCDSIALKQMDGS